MNTINSQRTLETGQYTESMTELAKAEFKKEHERLKHQVSNFNLNENFIDIKEEKLELSSSNETFSP